jgi:hypothetical protein
MRFVTAPSRHERIFHGRPYSWLFHRDKVANDLWYAMQQSPRGLEDLQLSWAWVKPRLDKLEQGQPSETLADGTAQVEAKDEAAEEITAESTIKSKEAQGKYDVFLCHNSKDKAAVEEIAKRLKSVGIRPWLDKWDLAGGDTVADALEKAITSINCAAIFFGPADRGNWHLMEIRAYVEAWAKKQARLIPVILPDAPETPSLPIWLRQTLWVNMREWKKEGSDAFYNLVCSILGRPPGDSPKVVFTKRDVNRWRSECRP